jgi:hypothetical protein
MNARLTYSYAPAALADGVLTHNCWYTVYDRVGRVVIETQDEDAANRAAGQFDEITGCDPETAADAAMEGAS